MKKFITICFNLILVAKTQSQPPAHVMVMAAPGAKHILIVGGGSSHDFGRWFHEADGATLRGLEKITVSYTDDLTLVLGTLPLESVLVWTSNQPMTDGKLQRGIINFANAGHGLVLVHPGLWYNWNNWPEYNRVLVGGGAHGHDKLGEFEVTVKEPGDAIMAGVPVRFKITDELYHTEVDPKGTPIEVLAEAKSPLDGKTWPIVWIVKHPNARIVCITLGHDGGAHNLPAYKTILQNAVKWAGEK
jgi:type 1 glutamine amidotransferase